MKYFNFYLFVIAVLLGGINLVQAGECGSGDGTVRPSCVCGDTVVASTTLSGNLSCTGHGLVVGASNITIDGGETTLTGDGGAGDYGINNAGGWDNVTVRNFSNITNFGRGVSFANTTGSEISSLEASANVYGIYLDTSSSTSISSCTADFNRQSGIYLSASEQNDLSSNTASNNIAAAGIMLSSSPSNVLTGNTVRKNAGSGISLGSSGGNTLTGNTMSDNGKNFAVTAFSDAHYAQTIDTTNTVEGKPVYYLQAQTGNEYDGDTLGEIGMFWCISCSGITLRNAVLAPRNSDAIFLYKTNNSTIENNVVSGAANVGIRLVASTGNTIARNLVSGSNYGIGASNGNAMTGNTIVANQIGITSSSNTLQNNVLLKNLVDVYSYSLQNTLSGNKFLDSVTVDTVNKPFSETVASGRLKEVGDTVPFQYDVYDFVGQLCADCASTVSLSPEESSLGWTQAGSRITGSFVPTRTGLYTVSFSTPDANGNLTERRYRFLVGAHGSATTRFYLKGDTPEHGQPGASDARALLLDGPEITETWDCGSWVQSSPDDIPDFPISALSDINIRSYYKSEDVSFFSLERFLTHTQARDLQVDVPVSPDFTLSDATLADIGFGMDHPESWYWLSLKFNANSATLRSSASQPSYADFTYIYSDTPAIRSNSNMAVNILSATASTTDEKASQIVLENPDLATATSTTLVLAGHNRLFLNAASIIDSDANTTLTTSIPADSEKILDAVYLELLPNAGELLAEIDTWNTTGTNYRKWTEAGSGVGSAAHVIGDLVPGKEYAVKVDGQDYGSYLADGSGLISFNYTGGYSTKTFELEEASDAVNPPPEEAIRSSSGSRRLVPPGTGTREELLKQLQAQIQSLLAELIQLLNARLRY